MNMKKAFVRSITAVLAAALMVAGLSACGSKSTAAGTQSETGTKSLSGTVTASGSSALLPLAQDAADQFKAAYPDISVTLNAGGSGTGLKQVSDGSVDIGNSDVFAEEKLDAATAAQLVDHEVCVITMAAIVNNDVGKTVSNLTRQQMIDIFTGKTVNWSEVGGPDEKILLVTRPDSSGTRALFTKWALDGSSENSGASYLETDNSGELLQTVKDNKGAIGYLALSYLVNNTDVTPVSIDGAAPTLANTYNGTYSVWGYEHMYTKGAPGEAAQAFLDYIMSDAYSGSMEAQGYGVAAKMTVTR